MGQHLGDDEEGVDRSLHSHGRVLATSQKSLSCGVQNWCMHGGEGLLSGAVQLQPRREKMPSLDCGMLQMPNRQRKSLSPLSVSQCSLSWPFPETESRKNLCFSRLLNPDRFSSCNPQTVSVDRERSPRYEVRQRRALSPPGPLLAEAAGGTPLALSEGLDPKARGRPQHHHLPANKLSHCYL